LRKVPAPRSTFLMCERSLTDPSYPRYPRLPVLKCRGYELADDSEAKPTPPA